MCLTPIKMPIFDANGDISDVKQVSCGHCFECLAAKRRDWTFRLWHENFFSLSSFFCTLTYNDEHLPACGVNKPDVQKFLKRLRKRLDKFRYFLVSEYGDQFARPHYHFLIFFRKFVSITDVVKEVEAAWPFGFVKIGDVTISSIQYCSKYCLKDKKDVLSVVDVSSGEVIERNPTFCLMSRRPGIGAALLTDKDWMRKHTSGDGSFRAVVMDKVVTLPRYYRDKIFTEEQKLKHNVRTAEKFRDKKGLSAFDQGARGADFLHALYRRSKEWNH